MHADYRKFGKHRIKKKEKLFIIPKPGDGYLLEKVEI